MCLLWAVLDHFGLLLVVLDGCSLLFVVVLGRWCWGVVIECRGHTDVFSTDRRNLILNKWVVEGYLSPFRVVVCVFGWLFVVVCCCCW